MTRFQIIRQMELEADLLTRKLAETEKVAARTRFAAFTTDLYRNMGMTAAELPES